MGFSEDINKELIGKIVNKVVEQHKNLPINFFNANNLSHEFLYIDSSINRYIFGISDIVNLIKPGGKIRILEVGTYFGIMGISLSRIGYKVYVIDIPEFISNENLQKKFKSEGIDFYPVNLKNSELPFVDKFFDLIVFCEVLEHLNFNPIPILKEFNRILKNNGYIYMSVPNILSFSNRINLLLGRSILDPVNDFFRQLQTNDVMITDMHWRKYTTGEIKELFERLGFQIEKQYFLGSTDVYIDKSIKYYIKKIFFNLFPSLKGTHINIIRKKV